MSEDTLSFLTPEVNWDSLQREPIGAYRGQGSFVRKISSASKVPDVARNYMPGDPTRLIDWTAFARTDELLVRETKEHVAGKVLIKVDAGSSMHWPDSQIPGEWVSKLELALRVGLNVAANHIRGGDIVFFAVIDQDKGRAVQMRSLREVLNLFHDLEESGYSIESLCHINQELPTQWVTRRYFITDGLYTPLDSLDLVSSILIHCLSSLELDPSKLEPNTCFYDDSINRREYLGSQLASSEYGSQISGWCRSQKDSAENAGGQYILVSEETTITDFVRELERL